MDITKVDTTETPVPLEVFTEKLEGKMHSLFSKSVLAGTALPVSSSLAEKKVTADNTQRLYQQGIEAIYEQVVLHKQLTVDDLSVLNPLDKTAQNQLLLKLCIALQEPTSGEISDLALRKIISFQRHAGGNIASLVDQLSQAPEIPEKKIILSTLAIVDTIINNKNAYVTSEKLITSFKKHHIISREDKLKHAAAVLALSRAGDVHAFADLMQLTKEEILQLAKSLILAHSNMRTSCECIDLLEPESRFEITKFYAEHEPAYLDSEGIESLKLTNAQVFEVLRITAKQDSPSSAMNSLAHIKNIDRAAKEEFMREMLTVYPSCMSEWLNMGTLPNDILLTMTAKDGDYRAFRLLTSDQKRDLTIVEDSISKNLQIFRYLPRELRDHPTIVKYVIDAARQGDVEAWDMASDMSFKQLTSDDALQALRIKPDLYPEIPRRIRREPLITAEYGLPLAKSGNMRFWKALPEEESAKLENAFEAVKNNLKIFSELPANLQLEESILAMVRTKAEVWELLPDQERNAKNALEILKGNLRFFYELSHELRRDEEIVKYLETQIQAGRSAALRLLPTEKLNISNIKGVIAKDMHAYEYLTLHRKDLAINDEVVQQLLLTEPDPEQFMLILFRVPELKKNSQVIAYVQASATKGNAKAWKVLPQESQTVDVATQMVIADPTTYETVNLFSPDIAKNPKVVMSFLRTTTNPRAIVIVVDSFKGKPGFELINAALWFATTLFKADELVQFRQGLGTEAKLRLKKYQDIASGLSMEAQQTLALRTAGLAGEVINPKDVTWASRYLAMKYHLEAPRS